MSRRSSKTHPPYWQYAKDYLATKDGKLGEIITAYPGELLGSEGDPFRTLASAIIGQQISVKAADAIWARLEAKLEKIEAEHLLKLSEDEFRAIGLSRQKAAYMKSLSEFFLANPNVHHEWHNKHDEEVIKDLVSIKGIGRWTAEMFLIFHMLRADIFPIADLGVIKAINNVYGKKKPLEKERIIKIAEKWKPYRTVATLYLWRSLDPIPVQY